MSDEFNEIKAFIRKRKFLKFYIFSFYKIYFSRKFKQIIFNCKLKVQGREKCVCIHGI